MHGRHPYCTALTSEHADTGAALALRQAYIHRQKERKFIYTSVQGLADENSVLPPFPLTARARSHSSVRVPSLTNGKLPRRRSWRHVKALTCANSVDVHVNVHLWHRCLPSRNSCCFANRGLEFLRKRQPNSLDISCGFSLALPLCFVALFATVLI